MDREATPTLAPVPGIDLDDYKHTADRAVRQPGGRDTLARLCAESSDRIPKWLLPVDPAQPGRTAARSTRSALVVAAWARYAEGVDEQGEPIEVVDRLSDSWWPRPRRQARRTAGLHRRPGPVRRPGRRRAVRRRLHRRARLAAPQRRPRHPRGLARAVGAAATGPRRHPRRRFSAGCRPLRARRCVPTATSSAPRRSARSRSRRTRRPATPQVVEYRGRTGLCVEVAVVAARPGVEPVHADRPDRGERHRGAVVPPVGAWPSPQVRYTAAHTINRCMPQNRTKTGSGKSADRSGVMTACVVSVRPQ